MKPYSYFLFPVFFLALGVIAIGLSLYLFLFSIDYANLDKAYHTLIGTIGFTFLGLVFLTFRVSIRVDKDRMQTIIVNKVLGFLLSKDIVKIPKHVTQILIHEKLKHGRGYIQAVVGFSYRLPSSDLYFTSESEAKKIISTDHERAIKIAELLKYQLNLDYSLQKDATAN